MKDSALAQEWRLHQNQFDNYEKCSLAIKLVSILVTVAAIMRASGDIHTNLLVCMVIAILWLQDSIWKTFQSRIETRLLSIEATLKQINDGDKSTPLATLPYQFNQTFMENRPGGIQTLVEYVKQAIRPTIAFPHIALIGVLIIHTLCVC